ncbi:10988_t:CDS:2, partial [Funneliformis caledonium]
MSDLCDSVTTVTSLPNDSSIQCESESYQICLSDEKIKCLVQHHSPELIIFFGGGLAFNAEVRELADDVNDICER